MPLPKERIIEKLDELLSKNDYAAAKEHLLYWLEEAKGDESAKLLLLNELMGLSRKLCEKDNALFYVESALAQIEKMGIEENVGAATTYLNSATVYKAFSMPDESIKLFLRAKKIYESALKPNDARLAGLYNNMGLTLVDQKRFEEAEELYKKALSVLVQIEGKQPEQAITYLNMASAAEAEHGLLEGDDVITECINKAMALLDESQYQNDGNYAFVCEKCASVFGYYGYFLYENELYARARRIYERS